MRAILRGFKGIFRRDSKRKNLCENMKHRDLEVAPMVKRYGPRVELTCKVILAGDQSYCEGRVLDVSLPGCLIECVHPLPLRVGDYVRLRLFLPDQARPMNVPLAAVRWVESGRAGVEFIRSSKADQVRLATLMRRHIPSAESVDQESIAMHPQQGADYFPGH